MLYTQKSYCAPQAKSNYEDYDRAKNNHKKSFLTNCKPKEVAQKMYTKFKIHKISVMDELILKQCSDELFGQLIMLLVSILFISYILQWCIPHKSVAAIPGVVLLILLFMLGSFFHFFHISGFEWNNLMAYYLYIRSAPTHIWDLFFD